MTQRVLTMGGAGFIGSNFVRRSMDVAYPGLEGASVTVLDALTHSGTLENVAPVADSPRFTFVPSDIHDSGLSDRLLPSVEAIVRFAAQSYLDRSALDSGVFVETNVLGPDRLRDAVLRHGTGRSVQFATDDVYDSIVPGWSDEPRPLGSNSRHCASMARRNLLGRRYISTGPTTFPRRSSRRSLRTSSMTSRNRCAAKAPTFVPGCKPTNTPTE